MVKPITAELAERVVLHGELLKCKDIHDFTCEYEALGNPKQSPNRSQKDSPSSSTKPGSSTCQFISFP